jgi:tetratricopeptide (TPR) repeat protein
VTTSVGLKKHRNRCIALAFALTVSACAQEKPAETNWKTFYDDAKFLDIQEEREKAKKQYSQALDKLTGVPNEQEWRAEILARLARLEIVSGSLQTGNKLAEEALKITLDPKTQGPNHGEVLIAIDDLAEAYSERSYRSKPEQIECLQMAIKLLDQPFKRPSKVYGRSITELAVAYLLSGDKAKAAPLADLTISRAKAAGSYHELRELAAGYKLAGDEKKQKEIMALAKTLMKDKANERQLISSFRFTVARMYKDNGRYSEAAKTIHDYEKEIAPRKPTAAFYEELAEIYEQQGKLKEADAIYETAIKADRVRNSRKYLRKRLENYARYLTRTKRPDKAEVILKEADGMRDTTF